MPLKNKVVWTEGMFLQPQHFQQHDRYIEALVAGTLGIGSVYPWGFKEFTIDESQLQLGKISLVSFAGVFPDGTMFSSNDQNDVVEPLEIPKGPVNETIVLAIAERRNGVSEVETGLKADEFARYYLDEQIVHDANSGYAQSAELQLGKAKLRLAFQSEVKNAYSTLAVVHVIERRDDGSLLLNPNFSQPSLTLGAAPFLVRFVDELRGLIVQRSAALAGRLGSTRGGVGEIQDFLFLQVLNRTLPVLGHLSSTKMTHPEQIYRLLAALAGELCTFTTVQRTAAEYPGYQHDLLFESFQPVIANLRSSLSLVIDASVIPIPIEERKHGVRVAVPGDRTLYTSSTFYLVINADAPPDFVRSKLVQQMKIGPTEKIRDLVNFNLPGIGLRYLPVAPQRLPFYEGFTYFEMDSNSDLWRLLASSGGIAIHVMGEVPNLRMEMWAARKQA